MARSSKRKLTFFYVEKQINIYFLDHHGLSKDLYKKWPNQKKFYAFSEKFRKDAEFDFNLFTALLHDPVFLNQSEDIQERILFYYFYYLCFLLNNSICANNLEKIAFYKNNLRHIFPKNQKEIIWQTDLGCQMAELHISAFCDGISYINAKRLNTDFCRLTWKNFWLNIQNNGLLESFQKDFGLEVNLKILDLPGSSPKTVVNSPQFLPLSSSFIYSVC